MSKEVILLGGGRSVLRGIEKGLWDKIRNKCVWSLNFAFLFMPFVPVKQVWVDTSVWEKCKDDILKLHSKGCDLVCRNYGGYEDYPFIKKYDVEEIDYKINEHTLFVGRCGFVGVFALSLAIHLGYTTIYLLGYDFGAPNVRETKTHWYQELSQINAGAYGKSGMYFEPHEFLEEDADIYNVSPNSNIESFLRITYPHFFERISAI